MKNTTPIHVILDWFKTGDYPTSEQFVAAWSSVWNKNDKIPQSVIEDLDLTLGKFANNETFGKHLKDDSAHDSTLLRLDGVNLNDAAVAILKEKLQITYNATVDNAAENTEGNVYNKEQISEFFKQMVQNDRDITSIIGNGINAQYNDMDETLASDIVKRVDFSTGADVNYRETVHWIDGSRMIDEHVDGFAFIKKEGKYYAIVSDDELKPVENFGIKKNDPSAAIKNSYILKFLIKNKVKNLFSVGDYYFDEIVFDEAIENTYLFSNAKKFDDIYSNEVTRIIVQGANFVKYKFDYGGCKVYTENIQYQGSDVTNNCFVREIQNSNWFDFSIIGKNLRFHKFNYAFKSESFSTGCVLERFILSDNKFGFWSERASNFSRFDRGQVWGNAVGIKASGFQMTANQIELMLNGSSGFHNGKRFGIISNMGSLSDIYQEEYGGIVGMSRDTHVYIYDESDYEPESGLVLTNVTFPAGDFQTNILTKSNKINRIKINAVNDFFIPKSIRGVDGKAVQGISVNGQNITFTDNATLMNKREFHIIGFSNISNGFAPQIDGFIQCNADKIKGLSKIDNYAGTSWDSLYNPDIKTVMVSRDSRFSIDFDFSIKTPNSVDGIFGIRSSVDGSFFPLSIATTKELNGEKYWFFKGYREFGYEVSNLGSVIIGFMGQMPDVSTFTGRVIIKDL